VVARGRGQTYSISSLDVGEFVDIDSDMEKRLENSSVEDEPPPKDSKYISYEDDLAGIEVRMDALNVDFYYFVTCLIASCQRASLGCGQIVIGHTSRRDVELLSSSYAPLAYFLRFLPSLDELLMFINSHVHVCACVQMCMPLVASARPCMSVRCVQGYLCAYACMCFCACACVYVYGWM
jgi:hypothetical protein